MQVVLKFCAFCFASDLQMWFVVAVLSSKKWLALNSQLNQSSSDISPLQSRRVETHRTSNNNIHKVYYYCAFFNWQQVDQCMVLAAAVVVIILHYYHSLIHGLGSRLLLCYKLSSLFLSLVPLFWYTNKEEEEELADKKKIWSNFSGIFPRKKV